MFSKKKSSSQTHFKPHKENLKKVFANQVLEINMSTLVQAI